MFLEATISLPAKALLFGEYAVMSGGVAAVATMPRFRCAVHVSVHRNSGSPSCEVVSDFFEERALYLESSSLSKDDIFRFKGNKRFWAGLLLPWAEFLLKSQLKIEVLNSFSPALGFGSSSALVGSVHLALKEIFLPDESEKSESFCKRVRDAIVNIQGRGSCYDVFTQIAARAQVRSSLWSFRNKETSAIPELRSIETPAREFGILVATGVYSDTASQLSRFSPDAKFIEIQATLAQDFLASPTREALEYLMPQAMSLAEKNKLLPTDDSWTNQLKDICFEGNIPFKTMGAGGGDCLWLACSRNEFLSACFKSGVDQQQARNCIVFEFGEN